MGLFSFAESKKFLGLSSASSKGPRFLDVHSSSSASSSSHSSSAFISSSRESQVSSTSLEEDCRPLASQADPGRHSSRVDRQSPIAKPPLRFGTWLARQATRVASLQGHSRVTEAQSGPRLCTLCNQCRVDTDRCSIRSTVSGRPHELQLSFKQHCPWGVPS